MHGKHKLAKLRSYNVCLSLICDNYHAPLIASLPYLVLRDRSHRNGLPLRARHAPRSVNPRIHFVYLIGGADRVNEENRGSGTLSRKTRGRVRLANARVHRSRWRGNWTQDWRKYEATGLVTATDPDKSASHTRYLIGEQHAKFLSIPRRRFVRRSGLSGTVSYNTSFTA